MAVNITSGQVKPTNDNLTADRRGRGIKPKFWQVHDGIASKVEGMTPTARNTAISTAATELTGWNFQAAQPTVARENALFVSVAVLYIALGIIFLGRYGR